jgi:hypothetical protein
MEENPTFRPVTTHRVSHFRHPGLDVLRIGCVIRCEMVRCVFFVARRLPLAIGILGVWFAVERWVWFHALPRRASARWCGNCFLAAVGVPTELGLLGVLVVAASIVEIPNRNRNVIWWFCAVLGVFLTPEVVGVPLFAFAFLALLLPFTNALFKGVARVVFRA